MGENRGCPPALPVAVLPVLIVRMSVGCAGALPVAADVAPVADDVAVAAAVAVVVCVFARDCGET